MGLNAGKYSAHHLEVQQKIAELDREGRSFASIAGYLNDHGFTSASGKSWTRGMVVHLLYRAGRKRESLDNIHYSVITEARARGLGYREMAMELNKRRIRRRRGRHWTAMYAQRRWYYLNRMQRQRKKELALPENGDLQVPGISMEGICTGGFSTVDTKLD
jgi:hypothetical protein